MTENSRLRVANSGPRAFAGDFATNAAVGRWLRCVTNPDPTKPLDVDWQVVGGAPIVTQVVNVNKGGSDVTGDGSAGNPFLTIAAAYASILDASNTKLYVIFIGPGQYADPFAMKANIYLVGIGQTPVIVSGAVTVDAATFADANDHFAGSQNVTFWGNIIITSLATGLLCNNNWAFVQCQMSNLGLTPDPADLANTQASCFDCDLINGASASGSWAALELVDCRMSGGQLNVAGLAGKTHSLNVQGGVCQSSIVIDLNGAVGLTAFFLGCDASRAGFCNLTGASPALDVRASPAALPQNPTLAGGAVAPLNTICRQTFTFAAATPIGAGITPLALNLNGLGVLDDKWDIETTLTDDAADLATCVESVVWANGVGTLKVFNPGGAFPGGLPTGIGVNCTATKVIP